MATESEKIVIEIDVNSDKALTALVEQKNAVEGLKKTNAELKKSQDELKSSGQENTQAYTDNAKAIAINETQIKTLNTQIGINQKIVQNANVGVNDQTGAYQRLSNQYSIAAQKAKDIAAVYGTNSEQFKKAAAEAKGLSDNLKKVDDSVGQNQRNVGNYSASLGSLPGVFGDIQSSAASAAEAVKNGFGKLSSITSDFTASMIAHKEAVIASEAASKAASIAESELAAAEAAGTTTSELAAAAEAARATATTAATVATETGTTAMKIFKIAMASTGIGLLVVALGALVGYFTSTNEGAKVFQRITSGVNAVVQTGVKILGSYGKMLFDIATLNFGNIKKDFSELKNNISGAAESISDTYKAGSKLKEQRQELTKAERKWSTERIEIEGKVGVLEIQASKASALSAEEKKKAAQQAISLRKEIFNNDIKYANENLKLVEKEQSLNSKKDYQAIADAKNRVAQTVATKDNELQSILNKESKADVSLSASKADFQKKRIEKEQKQQEDNLKKMQVTLQIYEEKNKTITIDSAKEIYKQELAIIEQKIKDNKLTTEEADLSKLQAKNKYNASLLKIATDGTAAVLADLKDKIKKEQEEKDLSAQQRYAKLDEIYNAEIEAAKKIGGDTTEITKTYEDEKLKIKNDTAAKKAELEIQAQQELDALLAKDSFDAQQVALDNEYQQKMQAAQKVGADTTALTATYEQKKLLLKKKTTSAELSLANTATGQLAELFGKNTKAGKAAASAQVAIQTYQGSMAAWASAMELPTVIAPVVGAAMVGLTAATGLKNIAEIWKVSDSGTSSVADTSSSSSSVSSSVAGSIAQRTTTADTTTAVQTGVSGALETTKQTQTVLVIDDVTDAISRKNTAKVSNSL